MATLDLPTPRPFVSHDVDFSVPSPMGFAQCKACGEHVDQWQWAARQCPRAKPDTFAPVSPGEVACAICHAGVYVEPPHRAFVVAFGTSCNSCFYTPKEKAA